MAIARDVLRFKSVNAKNLVTNIGGHHVGVGDHPDPISAYISQNESFSALEISSEERVVII